MDNLARQAVKTAIHDAQRFGESTLAFCADKVLVYAVPILDNQILLGGVVVFVGEHDFFWPESNEPRFDFKAARQHLCQSMEELNMTNGAALERARLRHEQEDKRADAILASKQSAASMDIRQLYTTEEPALFAAIHRRDLPRARQIINRILLAIHSISGDRIPLAKGFFLELVVAIHRKAIEEGADPNELLGKNYLAMQNIRDVDDLESLTHWLVTTLETLLQTISRTQPERKTTLLQETMRYLERHFHENVGRDEVANKMGLSPNHFSTVIRREAGTTFNDLLNRMRTDAAAHLLIESDDPLSAIALKVGFSEQSHFTRVFKKHRGITPLRFRKTG